MRSDLQDGASPRKVAHSVAETRIEETRIVYAEFPYRRIKRHHLCRVIRRHSNLFLGCKNVEITWIQYQPLVADVVLRIPELFWRVMVHLAEVDHRRILLGFICDDLGSSHRM